MEQEKNHEKFRVVLKKNQEIRSFHMSSKEECRLWRSAIKKLIDNEDADLEELRKLPQPSAENPKKSDKDTTQTITTNESS